MTQDLPPGVDDLGRRLEEAAAREIAERPPERRGRRRARYLGLPVAAAVVAAAVSAGAVRVVDRAGEPIEPERGAAGGAPRAPQDRSVIAASAVADPAGGPPWVVRAYTTAGGRACAQVGRLREGVFGHVQNGRFRALPASSQGSCARLDARGVLVAVERRPAVNLTIVFGVGVDRSPVTIRYGSERRRVQPRVFGAFLALFEGADPHARVVVRSRVAGRLEARGL